MDRDEKMARLRAWLDEYKERLGRPMTREFENKSGRCVREREAVRHELDRQVDKKIIEELGLFDE